MHTATTADLQIIFIDAMKFNPPSENIQNSSFILRVASDQVKIPSLLIRLKKIYFVKSGDMNATGVLHFSISNIYQFERSCKSYASCISVFFLVFEVKTNKKVQVHTPLCCYGALCGGFYLKIDLCSEFFLFIFLNV